MSLNNFLSPFLAVQSSFWPILISFAIFSAMAKTVLWINMEASPLSVSFAIFIIFYISFLWWKDFTRESMVGYHTHKLEVSLRVGMLLFILSEIFFFLSFFWAFYDAALSPTVELGMSWPPLGIIPLGVYSVPLLNTIILLTSGITVTWAHHSIMNNFYLKSLFSLGITVFLGAYFLIMQYLEYDEAQFSMADSVYGCTFFVSTGFHGMHVLVGTTFLFYVFLMLLMGKLLFNHHLSFEAAAWYWHFVDVVWLILFLSMYWWSSLDFIS